MRRPVACSCVGVGLVALGLVAIAAPATAAPHDKVTICHADSDVKKPYVEETVGC